MRLAAVILNYNTAGYLRRFLPPLLKSCEGLDAGVVVVDNASTDGSAGMLGLEFPQVRLIRLEQNYGFTGGYNRALDILLSGDDAPEYFVLLNSDVDVEEHWLRPMLEFMDSRPDCAVCGPKLLKLNEHRGHYTRTCTFEYAGAAGGLLDRYGYPFCHGRALSRLEDDHGQYDGVCDVMWVSGACLMARSSVWKQLGGFDRRFFMHMEEIDYCWRVQLSGYKVCLVPTSRVYHIGGGSLSPHSPTKLMLNHRNSLLMLHRNLEASIGKRAARRRIAVRSMLDFCTGAVYLLSGNIASFSALRQARREARELLRVEPGTAPLPESPSPVTGIWDVFIVLRAALHRKGVFENLRKYENRNRRGR